MSQQIAVEASEAEVRAALEASLTADELAKLGFEERQGSSDLFEPGKRGEAVTFLTIVIWTGGAAAGGVIGGAAYDLLKKAGTALVAKFGKPRVKVEQPKT